VVKKPIGLPPFVKDNISCMYGPRGELACYNYDENQWEYEYFNENDGSAD
jgi:hypothetical protein